MSSRRTPDADSLADHAAFVRAVARAALRGDDAVDDVVQDTYAAALASAPREPGRLRAWLAGIARRQAAARIRKRDIRRRGDPQGAKHEPDDSTLDVAVRVETSRHVVDAVLSLEEPYRSAILLRFWDALPPREIARKKDVPVETARTWVKRGLAQLRVKLERDHEGERGGWRAVLLPLATWPEASTAAMAVGVLGGALLMKKVAAVVAVLLLVTAGLLWWNAPGAVDEPDPSGDVAGVATHAVEESVAQPPSLAGRAGETATPPHTRSVRDLPFRGRVVQPDGRPLAGVKVDTAAWLCCTDTGLWTRYGWEREELTLSATTDADGRFAFPVTPDGAEEEVERPVAVVEVQLRADGYVPAEGRIERGKELEIRLRRGGTLAVKVVTGEGDPVPEARVQVLATTAEGHAVLNAVSREATAFPTGDSGWGETLVPPGRYRVRARAPGHAPGTVEGVEVTEGGRTERTVRMGEALEITVRLLGPDDEPVVGAHVRLAGPLHTTAQFVSDAEGRGRTTNIAPPANPDGSWSSVVFYRVQAKGLALRSGWRKIPREVKAFDLELRLGVGVPVRLRVVDDAGTPYEQVHVGLVLDRNAANSIPSTVSATKEGDGWVTLPRLGPGTHPLTVTLRGHGYHQERLELVVGTEGIDREIIVPRRTASLAGMVLLPDGSPATSGVIGVAQLEGKRFWRLAATFTGEGIASDGTFTVPRLKGGRQALVATIPGFVPQWQEIEIVPGEARKGVLFQLERRGRVRGRVLGWKDESLAGAEIQLYVLAEYDNGAKQPMQVPLTATDAEGRFEVLGVDEHPITLSIALDGWTRAWPWPKNLEPSDDEALFVMKPASEGSGMPFLARVTADGVSYEGKLGATVMEPGGGNPIGTDSPVPRGDGVYEVRVHLRPPGTYDVRFSAKGWQSVVVPGIAVAHRPPRTEVDVALTRGAVLELRVTDADGRPWADKWIGWRMGQVKTDEHGVVRLGGLQPGEFQWLNVQDPVDFAFTYAWFTAVRVPGVLDVVLRRCGKVVVKLPVPYAELEHDVVLRLFDAEGTEVDTYTIQREKVRDWHGSARWALKAYADGTYRAVVETGGRRVEGEIEARVGKQVSLSLDTR